MVMERPVVRQALRHYPAACFWGTPVIGQETSKTISCVALGRARLLPCAPDGRRLGAGRGRGMGFGGLWAWCRCYRARRRGCKTGTPLWRRVALSHAHRTGADLVRGAAGGWALAAYGLGAAVTAPRGAAAKPVPLCGAARLSPRAPDGRRFGAGRGLLWRITPLVAWLSPRAPDGGRLGGKAWPGHGIGGMG